LRRIAGAALNAADPAAAVARNLSLSDHSLKAGGLTFDLRAVGRIVVVGAGKAAVPMTEAISKLLGARVHSGLLAAPAGEQKDHIRRIEIAKAGHPIPDGRGLRTAKRIVQAAQKLAKDDLLIVLLSGGASSLLPLPAEGLTLLDKQQTTGLLLRSGATISEVNAVRKHLSAIKGGRLAAATPARVLTLILSDVQGDDLATIGSGPTAPDPTTFRDATDIVRHYGMWRRLPVRARIHLVEGLAGWQDETPKPRSRIFKRVDHVIIGNNRIALEAAAQAARKIGYEVVIINGFLAGEARDVGEWMGQLARSLAESRIRRPLCIIAGGELTVTVEGHGLGGRAQEFALAAGLALEGVRGAWVAGIGTDGRDGPTDVAGAVVDGHMVARAEKKGYHPAEYLARNDSYRFFKNVGGHIITGLTGTNVNDLYMMIIRPS
jgi:glycerate-2-kinase